VLGVRPYSLDVVGITAKDYCLRRMHLVVDVLVSQIAERLVIAIDWKIEVFVAARR
jgi:hypothetical protein